MLATERYLFVVYGGVLHQFDIDTLALRNKVSLESAPPTAGDRAGGNRTAGDRAVGGAAAGREVRAVPLPSKSAAAPEVPAPASVATMHEVVERALDWLARHQDDDGKWDADGFMKHDVEGEVCDGPGNATHDVAVTGLAMLAMLSNGSTLRSGLHKQNLLSAMQWLRQQQQDNGLFGANAAHDFIYDHAIATYAMCEAYGRSKYQLLADSAQRGINYLESHRNPLGVWRYQPRDGDNDSSVTAWCLFACVSGDSYGLKVNPDSLQLGGLWLDQVSDPTGLHGYTKQGERSSRNQGDHATRFPVEKGEAITAAALLCRYRLKQLPEQKPIMQAAANLLAAKPPSWRPDAGTIDEYYWYFATLAMQQVGGRHWFDWQKRLEPAVAKTQHADQAKQNLVGSWDPIGVWGENGGRVYSTALLAMTARAAMSQDR
ncbi:MAG: prenyltransferase/squalene oxidase repeat-containing protein [Planctomycetota bacterium]